MTILRKTMILTTLAAFALLSISAWAQGGSASGSGAGQNGAQQADQQNDRTQMREQQRLRQEELNRRLNFSGDQKQQWVLIQKQTAQQVKTARSDDSLNEEQMQEQQEELKKWWEEQRAAKQQQDAKADPRGSNTPSPSGQSKAGAKEDDIFAGMVQDPEPAPKSPKKH